MENNNIESLELEEMRQQMAELKSQLDQQLVVNEKKIKTSVKKELKSINNQYYATCFVDIVGFILLVYFNTKIHYFDTVFVILVGILAVVEVVGNKIICNALPLRKLAENDFSTSIRALIKMKKLHSIYYMVMIPMLAGTFTWEILVVVNLCSFDHNAVMRVFITAIICVIVCIVLFTYSYRKQNKKINYMIEMLGND